MGVKSIALATTLILSSSVNAAVITFNGTAAEGGVTPANNTTHSELGYSLVIGSDYALYADNNFTGPVVPPGFPGLTSFDDDVLAFNAHDASFVMTKDDGGLFDFISVETGSLGRDPDDDGNFIFTGTFGTGGTISSTILAEGPNVTTNLLSGFTGLLSLEVTSTDGLFPVLDNITVSDFAGRPVPVPAAVWLFGSGLIGLVGVARRKNA